MGMLGLLHKPVRLTCLCRRRGLSAALLGTSPSAGNDEEGPQARQLPAENHSLACVECYDTSGCERMPAHIAHEQLGQWTVHEEKGEKLRRLVD